MQIIASSKNNKPGLPKGMKIGYAVLAVMMLTACIALFINTGAPASFLLLLLYMGLLWAGIQRAGAGDGMFIAYLEGMMLRIDYEVHEQNIGLILKKFELPLSSITGYTTHSFLGMRPAFIQFIFGNEQRGGKSRPITIENLTVAEQQKLFSFLDGIIAKTRRLN